MSGTKKRKASAANPSPAKRAHGRTDDLSSLWRTDIGSDSLPVLPTPATSALSTVFSATTPAAGATVLSSALLGLGLSSGLSGFTASLFGLPISTARSGDLSGGDASGVDDFDGVDGSIEEDKNYFSDADDVPDVPAANNGKSKSSRVRSAYTRFPILAWVKVREFFLREVLRLDGRGDALDLKACPQCGKEGAPEYRCLDCRCAELCRECTVACHKYCLLHNIQRWNEQFYEGVQPKDLGLSIQLGHRAGETCDMRALHTVENFTIVHTNGIKTVRMHFCKCSQSGHVPAYAQLLRWRLWPATSREPESATSFEALDIFHRLSLYGKLNGYDFVRALEAATDGAAIKGVVVRILLPEPERRCLTRAKDVRQRFMTCIRQFRHIFMFKRAGRGHEPGGIAGTPPGACAVVCPACPNADYNLPTDWATRPFQVILSLDANFRLSNRLTRSSNQTDPNLTEGKAYMVEEKDYAAHIKATEGLDEAKASLRSSAPPHPSDPFAQPSTCSRFGAMALGNRKGGAIALRTTGIAGCSCARHEHICPQGIATLRRGERSAAANRYESSLTR
ncbi:unnamed protein product [Peniophora sp. CBMAI 1063]|nr:unnamed protein product [Peniophora sp. CBMAI 1063]